MMMIQMMVSDNGGIYNDCDDDNTHDDKNGGDYDCNCVDNDKAINDNRPIT